MNHQKIWYMIALRILPKKTKIVIKK